MTSQLHMLLVFLTLVTCATASASSDWEDKNLQNWENLGMVNIFGEPLDANTDCGGQSCVGTGPLKRARSANQKANRDTKKVCKSKHAVWENKMLQNWENLGMVNIFGEPLEANTDCGGQSCVGTGPLKRARSANQKANRDTKKVCRSKHGHEYICDQVPKGATMVSNEEYSRILSEIL